MIDAVIRVENLGKKYVLSHDSPERYIALRDEISRRLKAAVDGIRTIGRQSERADKTRKEDYWALQDFSFEVPRGQRLGIIGRNGAGKSTLLKLLSRITEPTTGRITLRGRVASLLEVGTGFHPELTGRENIFLNAAILGMSRAEVRRKFDEIVAFSEVERFLDTPVKHYSSGMYVRLAFAVAAHLEPEILIVDEVLAVGDIQFQRKCFGKMEEVGREGRTILFVSHNLTAVRAMCNRVLLIEEGKLVSYGEPAATIARYVEAPLGNLLVREWIDAANAPQNAAARLVKVAVRGAGGDPSTHLSTDTGWEIQIVYSVKQDGAFVGLTMILYDGENNCVFSSINNREPEWYGKGMPSGFYKSTCRVPSNLMNNGWFSLTVNLFGKNFEEGRMVKDVLRFEILDGPALRGDYHGGWGGVVRPDLVWTTVRVSGEGA